MSITTGRTAHIPQELRPALQRLLAEHAGALSAGAVIRAVASCQHELLRAGVRAGLPDAAEAMARRRLRGSAAVSAPAGGRLPDPPDRGAPDGRSPELLPESATGRG